MPGRFVVDKLTSGLDREGPGPLTTVPKAVITTRLDAAGLLTLTMPATDRRTALILPNQLNYARVVVEGDTDDMSRVGMLNERTRDTQTMELQARGPNLLGELTFTNVGKLALESAPGSGLAMDKADILDAILDGSGWTVDPASDLPSRDVYHRYGDETTLNALVKLATLTGDHFRLSRTIARAIVWKAAGADGYVPTVSGLTAKEAYDPDPDACLITGGVTMTEDGSERITRIYPRGGGNADAQLYINASTLGVGNPGNLAGDYVYGDYTLHIDTAEPWKSYIAHTLNDAAGSIGDVETIQDVAPIADTATDIESAANDLVLRTLVLLRRRLVDQRSFRFNLTHLDTTRLLEGDSIRLRARVYTDGYGWIDVNEDVLILDLPITFAGSDPVAEVQATAIASDTRPAGGGSAASLTERGLQKLVTTVERLQVAASHIQPAVRAQTAETAGEAGTLPDNSVAPAKLTHIAYLLDSDVSATAIGPSSAAETSVYSVSVPGGTLGTHNKLRLAVHGHVLNNTGSGQSIRVRCYYGATLIYSDLFPTANVVSNASARSYDVLLELSGAGATGAQMASGETHLGGAGGLAGVSGGTSTIRGATHTTVAEDSTAAKTLEVKVTLGTSDANLSASVNTVHLELVR